MALSRKSKLLAAVVLPVLLSSCADYMNHWDTVSFRAGNAADANTAIQAISPWPPNVENTTIEHGG